MKKKIFLISLFFVSLISLVGCGKSADKLKGTWKGLSDGESRDYQIDTTFKFDGNSNVEYENEYGIKSKGTYEIKDNKVTISLETWDSKKEYEFTINDNKLSLKATDVYSPSYSELIKQ